MSENGNSTSNDSVVLGQKYIFNISDRPIFEHKCGFTYNSNALCLKWNNTCVLAHRVFDYSDSEIECPNCAIEIDIPEEFKKYNILVQGEVNSKKRDVDGNIELVLFLVSEEELTKL